MTFDEWWRQYEDGECSFMTARDAWHAAQPRWIPCSERLPEEFQQVLIWGNQGQAIMSGWCAVQEYYAYNVTHWQPLPAPPETI